MQTAVGPELRGQITDRQPAGAADGQQVVAGEPDHPVVLFQYPVATGDDARGQVRRSRVMQLPGTGREQDRVVDGGDQVARCPAAIGSDTATQGRRLHFSTAAPEQGPWPLPIRSAT